MENSIKSIQQLMRIFYTMQHSFLRSELERMGLEELSNPKMLFELFSLKEQNVSVSQKELSDLIGISPPTAAISIKRMEKTGLVKKISNPSDLRVNYITLTEKGEHLTKECMKSGYAIYETIMDGFTKTEIETMCQYYLRMIRNLEKAGIKTPGCLKKE